MRDQIRAVRTLKPLIERLEKENEKLKRIIQENGGIKNDR